MTIQPTQPSTAPAEPVRLYGVSSGNGNDGVSHIFADFYVRTNDPWTLAKAAIVAAFKPGAGYAFAMENAEIDGEAEFTITATIMDPPAEPGEPESESSWSEHNGAWMIYEVFPAEEDDPRDSIMVYDSLDEALSADVLALVREADKPAELAPAITPGTAYHWIVTVDGKPTDIRGDSALATRQGKVRKSANPESTVAIYYGQALLWYAGGNLDDQRIVMAPEAGHMANILP